nr:MAG TPA: hypothetical protein [Caudoviricetes sp.]
MFLVVIIFLSLFLVIILSHTSGLGVKGITRLPQLGYGSLKYGIRHKYGKGTRQDNLIMQVGKSDVSLRRLPSLCISDVNIFVPHKLPDVHAAPSDVSGTRRERMPSKQKKKVPYGTFPYLPTS